MALISTTPVTSLTVPNAVGGTVNVAPSTYQPPNPTIRGVPLAPGASPFGTTRPLIVVLSAGQSKTLADLQADIGAVLSSLTVLVRRGTATLTFGTGPQSMPEGESLSWNAESRDQPFGDAAFAVAADANSEIVVTCSAIIP